MDGKYPAFFLSRKREPPYDVVVQIKELKKIMDNSSIPIVQQKSKYNNVALILLGIDFVLFHYDAYVNSSIQNSCFLLF